MDGQTILKIAQAYRSGKNIGTFEVSDAIKELPCYGAYALRLGNVLCDNARNSAQEEKVLDQNYMIPNQDRVLHEVCLRCPVFAPALAFLAKMLPAQ